MTGPTRFKGCCLVNRFDVLASLNEDCDSVGGGDVNPTESDVSGVRICGGGKKIKLPKNVNKVLKKESKLMGNMLKNAMLSRAHESVSQAASNIQGNGRYRNKQQKYTLAGRGAYRGGGGYRGSGSYSSDRVVYNQLFPESSQYTPMKIASANNETGNITIRKREYLFDVFSPNTPANFVSNKFQANPGLGAIGPFVSQIAGNYEKYRYRQLVFSYRPVVTDSSSTGQMGVVILAFNSNAGAQPFLTKQQMAEYDGSLTVRVCDEAVLGVECDARKGADEWNFVRTGNVPSGQDIKSYDFGSLYVATSGVSASAFPAGTQIGEMWVEYSVELAGPKLYDAMGYSCLIDSFFGNTGLSVSLPLGSAPLKSGANSLGGSLTKSGTTVYTFPDNFQGYVRVLAYCRATTTWTGLYVTPASSLLVYNDWAINSTTVTNAGNVSSATSPGEAIAFADYFVPFASSAGANTLTFSATVVTAGVVACLQICQISPACGLMIASGGIPTNFVPV